MQTATQTPIPATTPVPRIPAARVSSLDVTDLSSWVSRVVFVRTTRDRRFLAFYLKGTDRALLYSDGHRKLPIRLRDIFTGELAADCGLSIGKAYNRLVKGNPNYTYQSVSRAELEAVLAAAH